MNPENSQPFQRLNRNNLSIPKGATAHATVDCPQEGLTFNVCAQTGTTTLYTSQKSSPNSASYENVITAMAGNCRNMFVSCFDNGGRRKRQALNPQQRIFVTIEGVEEENKYDLTATLGDTSTPQGMCQPCTVHHTANSLDTTVVTVLMIGLDVIIMFYGPLHQAHYIFFPHTQLTWCVEGKWMTTNEVWWSLVHMIES